jgi:hypothetical protein
LRLTDQLLKVIPVKIRLTLRNQNRQVQVSRKLAQIAGNQMGRAGFEPATLGLRVPCSAGLSYRPITLSQLLPSTFLKVAEKD